MGHVIKRRKDDDDYRGRKLIKEHRPNVNGTTNGSLEFQSEIKGKRLHPGMTSLLHILIFFSRAIFRQREMICPAVVGTEAYALIPQHTISGMPNLET